MTKSEVLKLSESIKVFYHTFKMPPDLLEAWYDRLKDLPYDLVAANLNNYIANDEVGRPPTIAKLMRVTMSIGVDCDKEYRKHLRLSYYDDDTYIDQNGLLWAYPG